MGLDACVYCDCYEKGRLLQPPPNGVSLHVEPDGSLGCEDSAVVDWIAWDQWREQLACIHPAGMLLHHRLGNITLIGLIRAELNREPAKFPILLSKVVYSGSHAGDFLLVETIPALQEELDRLSDFKCSGPKAVPFISRFRAQMNELAAASRAVGKPVVF